MAIKTQAQILAESNSTYIDNSAGAITPNAVRGLNTDWIDSTLFAEATGSLTVFGATSASFAQNAASASFATNVVSSSFATSASYATSASFATNALTASFALNVPATASFAISASFSSTASLATRNLTTASATANIITFTKGDGSTFTVTVAQSGSVASASYADVANQANFATSASYALTASFTPNAFVSASNPTGNNSEIAFYTDGNPLTSNIVTINNVQSASFADNATSASFVPGAAYLAANNTFTGTNIFNAPVTMSNVRVTGTASVAFLDVTFQSSSVIYSSGSNQFGDAANDTQTLYGTVNVITGPLVVTGSSNFKSAFTASGLNYPTADNGAKSFIQSDGNGNLSLQYVETVYENVRNTNAFPIVKGSPIYVSGSTGDNGNVFYSDASDANTMPAVYIAGETLAPGQTGLAIVNGLIEGVDTTGFPAGTIVYVGEGGGWTSTRPTGSNSIVQVLGVVTKQGVGGQGVVINQLEATLPNISQGNLWVGNSSNQPVLVTTSSLLVTNAISSSFASTSSLARIATTASFALTASFLLGSVATASFALTAFTASSAISASDSQRAASGSSTLVDNYNGVNTTFYLTMVDNAAGYKRLGLDTDLSYNPLTNVLSATAQQAASASSITIDNYNGINTTYYLTMVDNAAGFKRVGLDTDLAYNPSTNLLTGLITSASFATSASRAISAASATSASNAVNADTASFTPNAFVSAETYIVSSSIKFTNGDGLGTFIVVDNVQSASFADNANTANSATTASYALTASYLEGAVSAFPFTGSAGISGSLNVVGALNVPSGSIQVTGSSTIYSGSLAIYSYKDTVAAIKSFDVAVTQSLNSTNNIISIVATSGGTGSIVISGSGNYVSLSQLQGNVATRNGSTSGFSGTNAYVTTLPSITGSNPNFNTTADRNNRRVPQITNSNVNGLITIQDNRASESGAPANISNSSVNMTPTIRIDSGSLTINSSQLLGTGTFTISGSGTNGVNASMTSNILALAGTSEINFNATSSGATSVNTSILVGNVIRVRTSGSSTLNSTVTTTPALIDSILVGRNLIVTGSTASSTGTANMAVFGGFNTADGLLNDGRYTRFAIGTGTAEGTRRTSFHVSASGMTTVNEGLDVRGTQTGTTELEVRATGVKIGNLITDSHNLTGSFAISGSQTITGSLIGQPVSQSVSSETASLDLRLGNFFNLTLPASTNTYVTASGQVPGQTINLKITQGATTGSVTFGSGIKQVSGSAYTVTATANAVDIVTFISFDETGLYMSNVKNLI